MELSVKTATEKEFAVDHCVATTVGMRELLYIEFIGYPMVELFPVFSTPEETQTIYGLVGGEVQKIFVGYSNLAEIFNVPGRDGHVRIRLEKAENNVYVLGGE